MKLETPRGRAGNAAGNIYAREKYENVFFFAFVSSSLLAHHVHVRRVRSSLPPGWGATHTGVSVVTPRRHP
jgi:hypothetical protein